MDLVYVTYISYKKRYALELRTPQLNAQLLHMTFIYVHKGTAALIGYAHVVL
jgi:hypothetical protein